MIQFKLSAAAELVFVTWIVVRNLSTQLVNLDAFDISNGTYDMMIAAAEPQVAWQKIVNIKLSTRVPLKKARPS